ncbi:hypoxanthine phosphoribosyltransferase [Parvularcula sp. ZS-1/3]|uniref:Hypoxanthine phosphoribosyltransferase n=1 Tax=Parvularcula mediterranea TaxID=2732508 RepID=A0A7Y3RMY3_9PROT|nr:phosphoribosyltransferase family protein [Parvularcula mediterranea]NNU16541.1 hypoxanthine phosphoribosyltransferase [Parvularcula mediterranea]
MDTLFDEAAIAGRMDALAREIAADLGSDFTIVPILTGGFIFGADLIRALQKAGADPEVDFVQLASYGAAKESSGLVRVVKDFTLDLKGRSVLLVDDVLDSGRSLAHARNMLREREAGRVAVAVAVRKDKERAVPIEAEYALFDAPGDAFLVGYGMDDAGRQRGLPSIGVLNG